MRVIDIVRDAAKRLENDFGLENAVPKVKTGGLRAAIYDPRSGTIVFSRSVFAGAVNRPARGVNQDSMTFYTCSEEAGHFLHHRCNPAIWRKGMKIASTGTAASRRASLELDNFMEGVACYAGLVYVERKFGKRFSFSIADYLSRFSDESLLARRGMDVKHSLGYMAGCIAYHTHGDSALGKLAHLPYAGAIKALREGFVEAPSSAKPSGGS